MNTLALARAAWGTALLTVPHRLLHRAGGPGADDDRAVAVARVLGARHLAQALVTGAFPRRTVLLAGAAGDAAHGASMLALARLDPARRRVALLDALVATGWGTATWCAARSDR
ncbi:hypothetical protein [Kineococcus rhizosphaerae]|uniref:DUF4267 domain-containing protein n=1 Tax=Kineococcus rhizosphaerae TaxID=559628 RepID=A0A2T0QZD9_9ACTN|nr:hypothetical protein [Kineococcus rhizosphaerae]PRY12054.1 hypothetical protein CLV37_11110 [Kineococcus rhizosphaerae]